ncbi:MAG: hypothetical protein Tp1124SUR1244132_4 [Prokaryotic dsDNA virus sp.]|nr:MAG: hypothetical protein Tp1124SUR1244132_4 [Prokaryotic dsDNA virus sp.]|tara:strand:+ start:4841 stop:5182 length:342 start_codon:yes stop_codon:yes gene_type:complete
MDFLDLNKLKDLPNVPVKDIVIPEWEAKVKVKGLTKKMQVELARISTADDTDAFDYQKALLKASVIEPQLDDKAIDMLYEKDATVIDKLFVEIADLNGVGGDVQQDIAEQFQE